MLESLLCVTELLSLCSTLIVHELVTIKIVINLEETLMHSFVEQESSLQ